MALSRKTQMIIISLALFAVLSTSAIYLWVSSYEHSLVEKILAQQVVGQGPMSGTAVLGTTGVLSYNYSGSYAEFAIVHYDYGNATAGNASLRVYGSNPVMPIYLVNVGYSCFRCFNEGSVYSDLYAWLGRFGLLHNSSSLSYVNLSQVPSLPPGSIIVVPSGLMPSALLPYSGASPNSARTDILDLLARGDVVIYAGANFSRSIENGITYISSSRTTSALDAAGLNDTKFYTATPPQHDGMYFNSSAYMFIKGSLYGSASYINSGNGTLIELGNYPVAGWSNASALAHDLAFAIHSRFWITALASSPVENLTSLSGTTTLFTTSPPVQGSNDTNAELNASYAIAYLAFRNGTSFTMKELPYRLRFQNNGTISMPGTVLYGQSVPISIYTGVRSRLSNVTIGNFSRNSLLYHIDIYNSTLNYVYPISVGFFNTSQGVVIYPTFSSSVLRPGYYMASLRDIDNRVYENALFYIPYLSVIPVVTDFRNGTFVFHVSQANQSVSGTSFSASIDGSYPISGTMENGVLNYTLPRGSVVQYGNQTLSLDIGGVSYSLSGYYPKPASKSIPPLYIEFGIAAVAILLLNLIAKAPNRDEYFIDVPAFNAEQRFEVKTPASSILDVFSLVNERFGWKYMPLSVEEVKLGISSSIRHDNIPIMITMENASEVLYSLKNKGKLDSMHSYFMPKAWSEESHHDIEYLVVFRKLRDFAVKNAILFTDLDSAGSADMIMTSRGEQRRIYIYSKGSRGREVELQQGQKTFMVFLDSESRAQFLDRLYSSYGTSAELLRMCISNYSIILIDADDLGQLLY